MSPHSTRLGQSPCAAHTPGLASLGASGSLCLHLPSLLWNAGIAKSDLCGSGDPDTGPHVVV